VSGSGQVSSTQTLDLKPSVSGTVVFVGVTPGQKVAAGTLVAEIDPTDAQKQVRDAQANLVSAELAYQKTTKPATTLTLTQAQNALTQAQQSLDTAYQTSYGDITSTFVDLPAIISGLQDSVTGTGATQGQMWNVDYYKNQAFTYSPLAQSYRDAAYNDYMTARTAYDKTFNDFKGMSSAPDHSAVSAMIDETNKTTSLVANAVKSSNDLIQFYSDQITQNGGTPKALAATQITSLTGYLNKSQSHITALSNDKNQLTNDASAIAEKTQSLQDVQNGADTLDVQSSQLSLTKAQNAVQDARDNLAKYFIRAPFAATVASVAVHKYDSASGAVATLVTSSQIAELNLNEVDAAKIQVGNKATLTFDAISDLTLTGKVVELDPVGTVTQGVVSYSVKISFDSQDPRIKAGMTVNADIQNAVHQNVLTVPSSAVKTSNGQQYVLVFNPPLVASTTTGSAGILSVTPPTQVPVTTGISDDTTVEVTSGLTAGEQVVTRTVTTTTAAKATTSAAGFGGGAAGARGGAAPTVRL
jgi:multidrug efflux pump subunit AcrA (membrane-fusion protein)